MESVCCCDLLLGLPCVPSPPFSPHHQRLIVNELALRPLPVFDSKYLPKRREETHKEVQARNAKIRRRVGRGFAGG